MDSKILITGASGFLGKIISNKLVESGYQLLTLGKQKGNDFQIDLTNKSFQMPALAKASIVIHAAGKAHSVPKTQSETEEFFEVNFEGTKNLCNSITSAQCMPESFIFISTVAVYGVDSGEFIDENHVLNGSTPYAQSKILAEKWLQQWAAENNVMLSILRLPLVAGHTPPGNLGAMINGIRNGKYLSIGNASAKKSMVWAEDIASIISQLAEKGGTYNLTDGYHPSFGELELKIAIAMDKKSPIKIPMIVARWIAFLGDFLGNKSPINSDKLKKITSTLTFDDTKARNILNWRPTPVLDKISDII
ncbi:MAG: UDP-galactose-4-epimerase [Mucilaginibacter sp.]|nr:UDP-galactose-4-epimerase [Mucilaginibacter sp.]